jgi:hypothetical protein
MPSVRGQAHASGGTLERDGSRSRARRTLEANPDKIKALIKMQDPVSVKDVQKLIGRVSALNRFIPRAAKRSMPFFQVLRSSKNFQWSET